MLFCKNAITAGDLEKSEERKENSEKNKKKSTSFEVLFFLELMTGFEPVTSSLPRMCATTCATSADSFYIIPTYRQKVKCFFEKKQNFSRK